LINEIKNSQLDPGPSPSYYLAGVYAQIGDIENGFESLQTAYMNHEVAMHLLKGYPYFQPLHSDPRWQEMLDKVGFPK
jgi:hypothetical protein